MKYRVEWWQSAVNELATIWVQADSAGRASITRAASDVETQLAHDPLAKGESRSGRERVMFSLPLSVLYEVDKAASVVNVLHINFVRPRKK